MHRERGAARRLRTGLLAGALAAGVVAVPAQAEPSDDACEERALRTTQQLLACLDAEDVMEHLEELQEIADENGGTRASGTPGYDESVEYLIDELEDEGFVIERQEFDYDVFIERSASLSVDGATPPFDTMEYSASGEVTDGNVVAVDLALDDRAGSTSGCEAADFEGLDWSGAGDIALMQRGACSFAQKAANAEAAGAEAAIVFNQGNTPEREALFFGTLGGPGIGIPVMSTDFATGEALATPGEAVSLAVDASTETRTTSNLIADLPGRNPDNVVMAGAHLDSVREGPGIQDNGSGSAALLALALQLTESEKYTPENTLRFAWWGAEESGLIGSEEYVYNPDFGLTQEEYEALALYLNFDMVASPNYFFGVYDADESTFDAPVPVPSGSQAIEDVFERFYTAQDVPYDDSAFSGRSDYQAFINVGIPAGGLFTGAEVIKTPEQEAIWGGTAGEQFDPCYHLACDTIDNVSMEALDVNVDAIATAVFHFAASTEEVNGVKGAKRKGPQWTAIDGPQGTFAEGGGGLSPDHAHTHGDHE